MAPLGCEAPQRLTHISITESLERTVTKLSHPLPSDAEEAADLFEGVFAAAIQPEVQAQDFGIAALEGVQRVLHLVREEPVHRLVLGVRQILGDEALDERAV